MVGIGDGFLFLTSVAISPLYFTTDEAIAKGIVSLGSSISGVIYPVIFRELQPWIGFGWTTRAIAFIALATSSTYLDENKTRSVFPRCGQILLDWPSQVAGILVGPRSSL